MLWRNYDYDFLVFIMIIIRYGEIALKGRNRSSFEQILVNNIKLYLNENNLSYDKISKRRGRIFIHTDEKYDLSKVFGVVGFSHALITQSNLEDINKKVLEVIDFGDKTTFRVSVKRIDKKFKIKSNELEKKIGEYVLENTSAKVSLKDFQEEIGVEIYPKFSLIYCKKIKAIGGMPISSSKILYCYIEKDQDYLAAFFMMRRGSKVILISKKEIGETWLDKYYKLKSIKINSLNEIKELSKVIVLGQNVSNFKVLGDELIELRPLIALSDKEIKNKIEELK